jgi:hypothetical protein
MPRKRIRQVCKVRFRIDIYYAFVIQNRGPLTLRRRFAPYRQSSPIIEESPSLPFLTYEHIMKVTVQIPIKCRQSICSIYYAKAGRWISYM